MDNNPQVLPDKNYCLHCGHPNPLWAISCEKCFKKLTPVDGADISKRKISRGRPGCVTAYAILLFISAGLAVLGGIVLALLMAMGMGAYFADNFSDARITSLASGSVVLILIIVVVVLIPVILNIVAGWGLWNLKNWARILVIVLQGLGLCGSIFSIVGAMIINTSSRMHANPVSTIITSMVSLLVGGIIIYWFVMNGDYFN